MSTKEPPAPAVYPASGIYRPPVAVTLTAELDATDSLFYVVETATGADQSPMVRKHRYTAPFILSAAGRARVTAFVWRQGYGEGPTTSCIFMLDENATPNPPPQVAGVGVKPLMVRAPVQATQQQRAEDFCRLTFTQLPNEIKSLEAFDIGVGLVDQAGFPCPGTFQHAAQLVISGEILGQPHTSQLLTALTAPPTAACMRHPPFVETALMLVDTQPLPQGGSSSVLARAGRGGQWNSFANTTPCIGPALSSCRGVSFRVASLARVIVGLHLGLEDASSELSWRVLPFSFHFSADLSDPTTVPAFRIYECGKLVEEAGTEEFTVGDEFAIKTRANGDIAYFRNGSLVYTSPARDDSTSLSAVYALHVRIASQQGDAALSNLGLIEVSDPFSAWSHGLLWKPSTSDAPKGSEHNSSSRGERQWLVLRSWISGTDYIPAVARVPIATNAIPRWAFAALSLASMFALGAVGCQSSHIASKMGDNLEQQPSLSQVRMRSQNIGLVQNHTDQRQAGGSTAWTPHKISAAVGTSSPDHRLVRM